MIEHLTAKQIVNELPERNDLVFLYPTELISWEFDKQICLLVTDGYHKEHSEQYSGDLEIWFQCPNRVACRDVVIHCCWDDKFYCYRRSEL